MAAKKQEPAISSGLVVIMAGLTLVTLTRGVDGFLGGMGQGAGVVLLIFGAYLLGTLWRTPKGSDDTWLPSRDGDV